METSISSKHSRGANNRRNGMNNSIKTFSHMVYVLKIESDKTQILGAGWGNEQAGTTSWKMLCALKLLALIHK